MKKLGKLATIALVLAAALSPVAAAQAAPAPGGGAAATAAPVAVESPDAASALLNGACSISFSSGGPADAVVLCGSTIRRLDWPDGRYEFVVIGSDRQVWHSYQSSAGGSWSVWGTLGTSHDVQGGVWASFSGGNPTVQVLGSDGGYWCNTFSGGSGWSNWYAC
ncbi:hypothetical protein ACFCX4_18565 [Kitasatospora sp. NPDC056327]|uniref:hypothetical protein n=1 Tax=Kitasatospora sp. NPDC056327 TaxID=3345785 RepID=UPI0035DA235B